jgi:ribosomal protein S6--L-glutamate ligase
MNSLCALQQIITLEKRFKPCPQVLTLGVRPNFKDYDPRERALIQKAAKIYYPSTFYAELFSTIGKPTFPNYHTYQFAQDKIKQTALFHLAGINHPNTRIFYGKKQKAKILDYFSMPFIAKQPRGAAMGRGVVLIRTKEELDRYCQNAFPAYIQEYLPIDRDIRIVIIGQKVRHAYWRIGLSHEYRHNFSQGGRIAFLPIPDEALKLALHTAKTCCWDDVGIDLCEYHGRFFILEGNMKYGREGFRLAGIDYHKMILDLIMNEEI